MFQDLVVAIEDVVRLAENGVHLDVELQAHLLALEVQPVQLDLDLLSPIIVVELQELRSDDLDEVLQKVLEALEALFLFDHEDLVAE